MAYLRIFMIFLAFGLFPLLASSVYASTIDDSSLIRKLIDCAPSLDSTSNDSENFHIDGELRQYSKTIQESSLRAGCTYSRQTGNACWLIDLNDQVPIIMAVNEQLLIYDPSQGVLRVDNINFQLELYSNDRSITFNWLFGDSYTPRILFDLKSLVRDTEPYQTIRSLGEGMYRLSATMPETGSRMQISVSTNSGCAYQNLALFQDNDTFILNSIRSGPSLPPVLIVFPDNIPNTRYIKTADLSPIALAELMTSIARSIQIRRGIHEASLRTEIENRIGKPLDWNAIIKLDTLLSESLRSIIRESSLEPYKK